VHFVVSRILYNYITMHGAKNIKQQIAFFIVAPCIVAIIGVLFQLMHRYTL